MKKYRFQSHTITKKYIQIIDGDCDYFYYTINDYDYWVFLNLYKKILSENSGLFSQNLYRNVKKHSAQKKNVRL